MSIGSYWSEAAHIIGSASNIVKHAGNILAITANRMLHGSEQAEPGNPEEEKHPNGDVFTNTERARGWEPREMHKDYRDEATLQLGFNSDHMGKKGPRSSDVG